MASRHRSMMARVLKTPRKQADFDDFRSDEHFYLFLRVSWGRKPLETATSAGQGATALMGNRITSA